MVRQHARRIEHRRALPRSLVCSGLAQAARTPLSSLGEMSPRPPEPSQRPAKPKPSLRSCLYEAPLQTRPQVLVLFFETPQPLCLLRTPQFRARLLGQCDEIGQVRGAPSRFLAAPTQPIQGVLAHG